MIRPPSTRIGARNAVAVPFRLQSKPVFHGSVPAVAIGLLLFRFEGVALWPGLCVRVGGSIPGDVLAGPLISVAAQVPLCQTSPSRAHASSSVCPALGAVRAWLPLVRFCGAGVWTAHPVQAPAGVLLFISARCGARWRVPAQVCAVQPLENSKASTSIFVLQATKSQR